VIYDDMVRNQWEDLTMKLGPKWSVADYTKAPQAEVLRRAEVLYDSIILAKKVCLPMVDLFLCIRTLLSDCRDRAMAMAVATVGQSRARARVSGRWLLKLRRTLRRLAVLSFCRLRLDVDECFSFSHIRRGRAWGSAPRVINTWSSSHVRRSIIERFAFRGG